MPHNRIKRNNAKSSRNGKNVNSVAVLTTKGSSFEPYAQLLATRLRKKGYKTKLFFAHEQINTGYETVFVLSYFRIIQAKFLRKHPNSLVVHASDLPKGRGWAPLFWQVIEGRNKIPIVLFQASEGVDKGPIYLKDYITLKGHELHDEIRCQLAEKTIAMCLKYLRDHRNLKPRHQKGKSTRYRRRSPKDSVLNVNKSIKNQFNLLRTVNNKEFPAFFNYRGHKYILHITKDE